MKRQRDELIEEQQAVWDHVMAGESCFLTGCGGTGKTYLTKELIVALKDKYGPPAVAVTATTGMAACHIGGTTLHSFAGAGLGAEPVERLVHRVGKSAAARKRWETTQCLVIDEISMLDGVFFDKLETIARHVRRNTKAFGGMQLLLVGDFLQLPPVTQRGDTRTFCFEAECWPRVISLTAELKHVFRQENAEFVEMLSSIRMGKCTPKIAAALSATRDNKLERPMKLFCKNADVDAINSHELARIPGVPITLHAEDDGEPEYMEQLNKNCLAPAELHLKHSAQVMLLKNIDTSIGLVNGACGVVQTVDIIKGKVLVAFDTRAGPVQIKLRPMPFNLEAQGEVVASRTQVPLRLAYAITVHKSQGMTISNAEMSIGDVFECGQAYVALSRISDLSGLKLMGFRAGVVRANPKVVEFYENIGKK